MDHESWTLVLSCGGFLAGVSIQPWVTAWLNDRRTRRRIKKITGEYQARRGVGHEQF